MNEVKKEKEISLRFSKMLGEMDLSGEELLKIKNHFLEIGAIIYEHYLVRIGNKPEENADKKRNNV
jgi:hypothetical protein